MNWKPSYYHLVYNYFSGSIEFNFFNLKKERHKSSTKKLKKSCTKQSLVNLKSPIIMFLFKIEKKIASFSLFLYRIHPKIEYITFGWMKYLRGLMWNFFVNKFYRSS